MLLVPNTERWKRVHKYKNQRNQTQDAESVSTNTKINSTKQVNEYQES